MTLPAFLFGFTISILYGALFHLWRGGGFFRLIFYIFLGILGFWIGQALAGVINWNMDRFGPLHLGLATASSWLLMIAGYWLAKIPSPEKRPY
jgi:hypothetical protein